MDTARILVVDDQPNIVDMLRTVLAFHGFTVDTAATAAGALEQAARHRPDLVLLDVMLPDADGFDILLRMRQHPALKHIPVVMLTGKATRQAVIKGLVAGADGYLTKPYEPEAVLRAVRTTLGVQPGMGEGPANDPWVNPDAKRARAAGNTTAR